MTTTNEQLSLQQTKERVRLPQIGWAVRVTQGPNGRLYANLDNDPNPHRLEGRELEAYQAGFVLKQYRESWYVTDHRESAPVARRFSSREEALDAIPEIQRDEVQLQEARKHGLFARFHHGDASWYLVDTHEQPVAGQFACWADMANAIGAIVQRREAREEACRRFVADERI